MRFRKLVFVVITLGSCGFAVGAGTMLLEDLDPVFKSNPVLYQTLTQAFDLWDRAPATGHDTSRATDKNPPWMLYGKPKGATIFQSLGVRGRDTLRHYLYRNSPWNEPSPEESTDAFMEILLVN